MLVNPRSLLPSALVVLSFLAACEGSPSDAPLQATVADSSGVRIISLGGGLRDAPTRGAELLWSHGFAEGEYQFQYALGGALLSEGVAMVADAGNDEVVAVSEQRFNVVMGSGQGPEEVLRPVAIRVADASSVWLDDDGNGRLVLLTPDKVLESVSEHCTSASCSWQECARQSRSPPRGSRVVAPRSSSRYGRPDRNQQRPSFWSPDGAVARPTFW